MSWIKRTAGIWVPSVVAIVGVTFGLIIGHGVHRSLPHNPLPDPLPYQCPGQTNVQAEFEFGTIRKDDANKVTLVGTTPTGCKIWQVEGPRMIVPLVFVESCNGHVATR